MTTADASLEAALAIDRPATIEKELLMILLAEPTIVARARDELAADLLEHRGLRAALAGLYHLHDAGQVPDLGNLQAMLDEFCWGACVYFEQKGQKLAAKLSKAECLETLIKRRTGSRAFAVLDKEHDKEALFAKAVGHLERIEALLERILSPR